MSNGKCLPDVLKIYLDFSDPAFQPCNGAELARILRHLAGRVEEMEVEAGDQFCLETLDGNIVGSAVLDFV